MSSIYQALLWSRWLVASHSSRRPRFDPRPVHVGLVANKEILGLVSPPPEGFALPPSIIFNNLIYYRHYTADLRKLQRCYTKYRSLFSYNLSLSISLCINLYVDLITIIYPASHNISADIWLTCTAISVSTYSGSWTWPASWSQVTLTVDLSSGVGPGGCRSVRRGRDAGRTRMRGTAAAALEETALHIRLKPARG